MISSGVRYNYVWKDTGWQRLHSRFGLGAETATLVKVGLIGNAARQMHEDSGLTIEEIGILNEFGSQDGHTPERSFMRSTLREGRSKAVTILARVANRVVMHNLPSNVALRELGQWAVDEMRRKIFAGVDPANAPLTVEKKGHGMTLRDSFVMVAALGYEIISGYTGKLMGSSTE